MRFNEEYTYKKNQKRRCIGFSSDYQIELMRNNPDLLYLGDATFDACPPGFSQIFILHLLMDSKAFPVLYVLCESKNRDCYKTIFNWLKSQNIVISTFMADYEKALRNGIHDVYPEVELHGCNFHYCQNLIKHVKEIKIENFYSKNIAVNQIIRQYMALAFIDPNEVLEYHKIIKESIELIEDDDIRMKLLQFNSYYEATWLHGTKYKILEWNQSKDIKRSTNNWCESFHSSFSKRYHRSHPNIYHLLFLLVQNDTIIKFEYQDLLNDPSKYINQYYTNNRNVLRQIMDKKNTIYKDKKAEYLKALGNHQILLSLKIEYDLLVANKLKPERVARISEMLEGKRELSIFDKSTEDIVQNGKKLMKLQCITKFHCKKINEIKRNEIEELKKKNENLGKEEQERKRRKSNRKLTKKELSFTSEEISELSGLLSAIDDIDKDEILKSKICSNMEEEIEKIMKDDEEKEIEEINIIRLNEDEDDGFYNFDFDSCQINGEEKELLYSDNKSLMNNEIEESLKSKSNDEEDKKSKNKMEESSDNKSIDKENSDSESNDEESKNKMEESSDSESNDEESSNSESNDEESSNSESNDEESKNKMEESSDSESNDEENKSEMEESSDNKLINKEVEESKNKMEESSECESNDEENNSEMEESSDSESNDEESSDNKSNDEESSDSESNDEESKNKMEENSESESNDEEDEESKNEIEKVSNSESDNESIEGERQRFVKGCNGRNKLKKCRKRNSTKNKRNLAMKPKKRKGKTLIQRMKLGK